MGIDFNYKLRLNKISQIKMLLTSFARPYTWRVPLARIRNPIENRSQPSMRTTRRRDSPRFLGCQGLPMSPPE